MTHRVKQDDFSKIDKKLSASFGLLILLLMAIVFLATLFYFKLIMHEEQGRLGSVIANSVGDAINRVSFSGKYQARLLVEELKSKSENIDSIVIQDPSGLVIAHSSSENNGKIINDQFFEAAKKVMLTNHYEIQNITTSRNGNNLELIEIDIPYKKGAENQIAGVTRVLLSAQSYNNSIFFGVLYLFGLIGFLVTISYFIVRKLSSNIGAPIKNLAFQFQGILKYTPLSICITNTSGEVMASSPIYDALYDAFQTVEIETQKESFVFESGNIASYDYTLVLNNKTKYYHAIKCPVAIDENGKVSLVCTITIDITEQKNAEENLKAINENLNTLVREETEKRLEKERLLIQQSKMAMMGEMIGAIAHQWRQPLNSLGLTVQDVYLAHTFGELTSTYIEKYKKDSMNIIHRMSKTIDDFRDFFKPDKSEEPFVLEHAVEATLNIMLPQLNNHNIAVDFSKNSEHGMYGYKSELEQALLILISNAKDALLDNKISKPKIHISIKNISNDMAKITVEDNGGGIREDIIDRIFEPYFTTKEQGKGIGIGLYMAKQIVERHIGGKLVAENTGFEHNGARFTMEIPITNASIHAI